MSEELKMTISEAFKGENERYVYVTFEDGTRFAEGRLPEGKIITNNGFSLDEVKQLSEYLLAEKDNILGEARKINAMKAFLSESKEIPNDTSSTSKKNASLENFEI